MTLIDPVLAAQIQVPPLDGLGFSAYPEVQPFSQRTASGYQEQLEGILHYLQRRLIPFLQQSNPQGVWDTNTQLLIDAVNTALTTQTADTVQKISDALTAIAESQIQVTDPAMLAVLQASTTATIAFLDGRYASYRAPAPSGGDDTAVLQELVNVAQATKGELVLREGTYQANLATLEAFQQPVIRGVGRYMTTIQPHDQSKPVVTFIGGSGSLAGGGLRSLRLKAVTAGTGIGLEYRGCGGVDSWDVALENFGEGLRFNNEAVGSFTEFDTFQGVMVTCTIPVHYRKNLGNESFHGSGVVGNTVITGTYGDTAILVDDGCFPYNAPLTATVFTDHATQCVVKNLNGGRIANFHGALTHEGSGTAIGDPTSNAMIAFAGTVQSLSGGSGMRLGKFYLVDKSYFNGGNTVLQYRPYSKVVKLAPGTTQLTDIPGGALIQLDILDTNYHYSYLLALWQSPYNDTGVVTVIANPETINTGGQGAPTFSVSNYGLKITNAAYSTNGTAYVSVVPIFNQINADRFGQ